MPHTQRILKTCLGLLALLGGLPLAAQEFDKKDPQWRLDEEQRATGLINQQHDFSPIDEAFALNEAALLRTYYGRAKARQFGYPRWNTPEEVQKTQYTEEQRRELNLEVERRALERLRQMPGLPRFVGDRFALLAIMGGQDIARRADLTTLRAIGDDDCIVQLGRFLFDSRNPEVTGPIPPGHLGLGVPSAIKYDVAGALHAVLRERPGLAAEIKAAGTRPGWYERAQSWWLENPEAAPYRRKLADLGVVLPPGYPPLAELKGAKTVLTPTPLPHWCQVLRDFELTPHSGLFLMALFGIVLVLVLGLAAPSSSL
ncbi:hypothetical protein [Prosthecobacter sp.]|uniref:hypothetical protein n=1 Tax=Prosthecobacter sp. TaxID=1965333 RepID=UPI0037838B5F